MMQRTPAQESIREEVAELLQVLGVANTRLNNLVNMVQGDPERPLNLMSLECLVLANKDISDAWETLQYFLDPEV
jgi:hypothetical protein